MNTKLASKPKWTAAERARHKAIRREFEHCPTQEDLQASGDYEGPIKSGAYFAIKVVIHELKKARQEAGLTYADVSRIAGLDQSTLNKLEKGRLPNPKVDTLWRYASAVGRQLVLMHVRRQAIERGNDKAAKRPRK